MTKLNINVSQQFSLTLFIPPTTLTIEMKQILLLVQNQTDVDSLPVATAQIKKLGTEGVWLLFSPTVLTDTETASREHDVTIRDIEEAMKAAAGRLDFAGAAQYKLKLDSAILDKADNVKTAYKRLSTQEQEAAFNRVFKTFTDNPPAKNINVTQLSDHYEPSNWIEMLNSIKGAWFSPFVPGTFSVAWASSFSDAPVANVAPAAPPVDAEAQEASKSNFVTSRPEFKAILAMGLDGMGHEAISLGMNPSGMNRLKLAHAIYKKKHGATA